MDYGGLIETMYSQYSEEEIPENIRKLKERIDSLFSCEYFDVLKAKINSFSKKERDYLGCKILDDFYTVDNSKDIFKDCIVSKVHIKVFKLYLKLIPNDRYGLAQLSAAAGNLEIIKYLFESYFDSYDILENIDTTLVVAAGYGHLDIVKYLVENLKANVTFNESEAFRFAIINKESVTAEYLAEHGSSERYFANAYDFFRYVIPL